MDRNLATLVGRYVAIVGKDQHDADANLIQPAITKGVKFELLGDKADVKRLYLACRKVESDSDQQEAAATAT